MLSLRGSGSDRLSLRDLRARHRREAVCNEERLLVAFGDQAVRQTTADLALT
jgi:hypothetical protein